MIFTDSNYLNYLSESKYGVKTKIVDVDFTAGSEIYDRIAKEIEGLEIGVLVNNVGMSYSYPEYLAQVRRMRSIEYRFPQCGLLRPSNYPFPTESSSSLKKRRSESTQDGGFL